MVNLRFSRQSINDVIRKATQRLSVCNNSCMFKIQVVLILTLLVSGEAWALDEFEGVKCDSDVPKALVGKRDSNQRVVVLEERHKDLGLKDLGGFRSEERRAGK